MTIPYQQPIARECYRCGYDLRGIGDDQACPECGLLAGRSRRVSDELHESRPKWLHGLARGVKFILLAILIGVTWPVLQEPAFEFLAQINGGYWMNRPANGFSYSDVRLYVAAFGFILSAALILAGTFLLTRPEGYELADHEDHRRRFWLRLTSGVPLFGVFTVFVFLDSVQSWLWHHSKFLYHRNFEWPIILVNSLGAIPFVLLLFFHFRSLAKRARSAHLAEHCAIVAYLAAATLVFIPFVFLINENGEHWFGVNFIWNSPIFFTLMLLLSTMFFLFILWTLYLLIRFAISFHKAARALRGNWKRDDRAEQT